MIKYLYIETDNAGVRNKIKNQIKGLNQLGLKVEANPLAKESMAKRLIPFQTSSADWNAVDLSNTDGIYLRYPFIDFQLLRMLKRYKKTRQSGKIIIEIPAYPNKGERYKNKIVVVRDGFYRTKLKKYIDHIVYEGDANYSSIFGVAATRIINGIDVNALPLKKKSGTPNKLRLICVASFFPEYGMDRVIRGMHTYYSKDTHDCDVTLHLVGRGPEVDNYLKLARECGIKDKVVYHGYKTGTELDKIFDESDIGIDAIALYRKGLKVSSTLKTREYMARGLPFIYSSEMPGLANEMEKYTLFFDNNDKEIDISQVVVFYGKLLEDDEIGKNIRRIANETIDMRITMKPVADLLLS